MLYVDDRVGSKDLLKPLRNFGVQAELMHLEYGDFAFVGRGMNNSSVTIGIELKETSDLLKSLSSGRFTGHQLPGLLRTYDRAYLLTEGIWRGNAQGVLEVQTGSWTGWRAASVGTKRMMARDLEKQLLTLAIRGGITHHHCPTRDDTIRWLSVLYHWWCDKSMDEHKSHLSFHQIDMDRALLEEPSFCRCVAKELPGIGWEKSRAVEAHFGGSVTRMCCAPLQEWTKIPGIGKTLAARIVSTFQGSTHATRS